MRIGERLVAQRVFDILAANSVDNERHKLKTRFLSAAVKTGRVDEKKALEVLAEHNGTPAVYLKQIVVPRETILRIPLEVAQKLLALPLRCIDGTLVVAMADPLRKSSVDELAFLTGLQILPHVALHTDIQAVLSEAYSTSAPFYVAKDADPSAGDEHGFAPTFRPEPAPTTMKPATDPENSQKAGTNESWVVGHAVTEPISEKKVILVVDDEPDIVRLIADALRTLGHEIVTASRGLEALQLVKNKRPHLVILDAMLPEVHGFEICRKIKDSKKFGHTPILMISAIYRGWRMAEDIKNLYRIDDFIEKPFRINELRRRAELLLSRPGVSQLPSMPDDVQQRYDAAVVAMQSKDLDKALDLLVSAESVDPFSARVQFLLGRVLEQLARTYQAIYHYERAIELDPKMFSATKNLALLYQGNGFRNKAIEMWERSLHAAPTDEVRDQIKSHLVSIL